jgi:hypothetical protein
MAFPFGNAVLLEAGFSLIMQFKIEQYERCQSMVEGSIEDHLIGITKPTIDRILKMENPSDCIALYTFYAYTRKWQRNNAVYATSEYAMKAMTWGRERFAKAKSQLKEAGFIEDIQRKDAGGKVIGWYVGVKFAQNATMGNFSIADVQENHPPVLPQGGSTRVWLNRTQIPITNIKIPNTGKEMQETVAAHEASLPSPCEVNKPKRQVKDNRTTEEFVAELKKIYDYIDIDVELKRIDAWLLTHQDRKKTRRFVTNWLNRIEKPMPKQKSTLGITEGYRPCL